MKIDQLIEIKPGVRLNVFDRGHGRPIVFLHGWPFSHEIFANQFEALFNEGYRVIGIDLRGFGKSDKPVGAAYDFQMHLGDIAALFDVLGLDNAVLLGYSFGGVIAALYAALLNDKKRVKKLLLLSANVPLTTRLPDHPRGVSIEEFNQLIALLESNTSAMIDVYGPLFGLSPEFMPKPMGDWLNLISAEASKEAVVKSIISLRDLDLRPLLSGITIPTVIFHAENDNIIPIAIAEEAHAGIANSLFFRFQDGGHWIFIQQQAEFTANLLGVIHN